VQTTGDCSANLPLASVGDWQVYTARTRGTMLQQANQTVARDLEWSCQAVSPMGDPCNSVATFHCGICGRWFCAAHAEDESFHTCILEPGDEGGEA
jgi:hypothetical protein